jgi:multiple sugar transport system substrate-binding protein
MFTTRSKPLTAVLMVAALAMTGCGRSDSTDKPEAAATIGSGPATGTLEIWAQAEQGAALPAFTEEFEKLNPDLTINVTAIPWDAAHNKYQTAIAGGSTPDIAHMGTTWMSDFADAFAPTPTSIDTSDFFPSSVKSTQIDGTTYGVPWSVDTRLVYYRKDLAAKAGYDTFPTTWDEFNAMAKAMQTEAGAEWGISLPAGGPDSFQSMLPFAWSGGADLMNSDQTEWTLDTPEWVDAMKSYQSFFTEKIATTTPDTGAGAPDAAFVNGSVPMILGGPSYIGTLVTAGGPGIKDKIGVGRIPGAASSTSFVGGGDLVVFEESKNQDAAWKFLQFMMEPEVQVKWQQAVGDLPASQTAWKNPSLAKDPVLSVFGEQLTDTKAPPAIPTWTQVSAAGDTVVEQIVKSGADPAEAMAGLQATANSIGTGD